MDNTYNLEIPLHQWSLSHIFKAFQLLFYLCFMFYSLFPLYLYSSIYLSQIFPVQLPEVDFNFLLQGLYLCWSLQKFDLMVVPIYLLFFLLLNEGMRQQIIYFQQKKRYLLFLFLRLFELSFLQSYVNLQFIFASMAT